MTLSSNVQEALSDIVTGNGVTRSLHDLTFDGRPVVEEFLQALAQHGFHRTSVEKVDVRLGERVPAFFIEESTAYFGWVFWEKFSKDKARKLWGSVVRNGKGDWAVQISAFKSTPIYSNITLKIEMDPDLPVTL